MNGLIFVRKGDPLPGLSEGGMTLLLHRSDIEIMHHRINSTAGIWLSPADSEDAVEFFVLLSGELSFFHDGEKKTLTAGDCFYAQALEQDAHFVAERASEILCITNKPVYETIKEFSGKMHAFITQIDQKDNITRDHSRNVMRYAMGLFEQLNTGSLSMDEMAIAAMFHDVGKCRTPDEILKKKGKLTADEYRQMQEHPIHSYDLLMTCYDEDIASAARSHHERLDGSGYPDGLSGDDIPFAAQIIAVADSFDAMTGVRPYNTRSKTIDEAILDLRQCGGKYNQSVVDALERLYHSGELELIMSAGASG